MNVKELSREELTELKQNYYSSKNDNVSYEELSKINELVTDEEIFDEYAGTVFTSQDFFCNSKPYEVPYKNMYGNEYTLIPELRLYDAYDMLTGKNRPLIAIQLHFIDEEMEREPFATLTVNFGEYIGVHNAAYIDTNNLGDSITDWLEEIGAGHKTQFTKQSGFCVYPFFVFDDEFLKKIEDNGQCYARYNKSFDEYNRSFEPEINEDEPDITDD